MKSVVFFGIFGSLLVLASPVQAQQCPGSHLYYIVRDAEGTPVNAATDSFTFRGGANDVPWEVWNGTRMWYLDVRGGFAGVMPTDLATLLRDRMIHPLTVQSTGCVFTSGATLSVMMSGRTMDLVFNIAFPCCGSHSILVDGLPFQEGHFEITPSIPTPSPQHHFFPAKGWTKSTTVSN